MPGGQVLLLLLAGAVGHRQEQDLGERDALVITVSSGGPWGDWAWPEMGPKGCYASSVGFKGTQHGLLSDEVAATSACFTCSNRHVLEGLGSAWGQPGGWSPQCSRAVCGIQVQQDPAQGLKRDDMALNDLCLFCCLQ
ncbi:vitelline membrane outer layer protein 1 homolog [Leptosomus discolor]